MNQSQNGTKEERKNTMSNHQPATLGRKLEQWMDEAEREPTERSKTEETIKGKTNNQMRRKKKRTNKTMRKPPKNSMNQMN